MNTFIRLVINFIASAVIILIFRYFGWLEFSNPPEIVSDPAINDIIIGGIISLIIFIIGELAGIAFGAFAFITCGIGCLLYPIFALLVGYIKLYGAQIILTDWFTFESIWWKVTIISICVGLFRIPTRKEQKKIIIHEDRRERHS